MTVTDTIQGKSPSSTPGTTGVTVSWNTVPADGELLTCIAAVNAADTFNVPSGWTQVGSTIEGGTGQVRMAMFQKIASSEGASVTVTTTASGFRVISVVIESVAPTSGRTWTLTPDANVGTGDASFDATDNTGSFTPGSAGDARIAYAGFGASASRTFSSVDNSFTQCATESGSSSASLCRHTTVGSGAIDVTLTWNTNAYGGGIGVVNHEASAVGGATTRALINGGLVNNGLVNAGLIRRSVAEGMEYINGIWRRPRLVVPVTVQLAGA